MAKGHENLIPTNKRSKEEARELGAKGGRKSGVSRRRKRILQEAAQIILNAEITGESLKELEEIGLKLPEATIGLLLIKRILDKALAGDVAAAKIFMELAGEGETFNIRREELKIKRAGVKALEKNSAEGSKGLLQLVETLRDAGERRHDEGGVA